MSYILDALKKAEAERDPDARASLAIEARERRRHRLLIYVVAAALIANATLLAWLFLPDRNDPTSPPDVAATPTEARPSEPAEGRTEPAAAAVAAHTNPPDTGASLATPTNPAGPSPAHTPMSAPEPAPTTELSPPATRVEALATVQTRLVDLPEAARRDFPALEFSTHIYADDPSLRAVVVNGVRLKEGDLLEGVVVHEITEDGAVFEYERYLVEVPILASWN